MAGTSFSHCLAAGNTMARVTVNMTRPTEAAPRLRGLVTRLPQVFGVGMWVPVRVSAPE